MMFRKTVLFIFLMCTTAFANTAEIQNSGENRYKAIRLSPEIYNNANSDLSDLRIENANGENIPYFIHSGYRTNHREAGHYPMSLINAYVLDDNFYFDYKLSEPLDRDVTATSVLFTTNDSTFAKNIDVYGSYDNTHWEFVQRDQIYRVSDKARLEIIFNTTQKFTHYRFRLNNNLERISFSSVDLLYNLETTQMHYFIETLTPEFFTEEENNFTYVFIEGLRNLRLSEIILETDSMFQRTFEIPSLGIRKELYSLSFSDTIYKDTSISFNRSINRDGTLKLIIHNGDDRPINITGITARYYADELIFEGIGETYTLRFGADANVRAPIYDITRYKDEILRSTIDRLDIRKITLEEIPQELEPEPYDFKMIFNIVIIAVTILLGLLIFLKLRKNSGV